MVALCFLLAWYCSPSGRLPCFWSQTPFFRQRGPQASCACHWPRLLRSFSLGCPPPHLCHALSLPIHLPTSVGLRPPPLVPSLPLRPFPCRAPSRTPSTIPWPRNWARTHSRCKSNRQAEWRDPPRPASSVPPWSSPRSGFLFPSHLLHGRRPAMLSEPPQTPLPSRPPRHRASLPSPSMGHRRRGAPRGTSWQDQCVDGQLIAFSFRFGATTAHLSPWFPHCRCRRTQRLRYEPGNRHAQVPKVVIKTVTRMNRSRRRKTNGNDHSEP